jgi:sugar lactone lactonase YvrE
MVHWNAELVVDARADLGEGPLWDARTAELLWVDIMAGLVHRVDPASGVDRPLDVGQPVGAVVPRTAGGYALAVRDGFAVADEGGATIVAPVEADRMDLRMNDGACDSQGRFWAGTMHLDHTKGAGSLYRLDPGGEVQTMLGDVTISNGIAWSPDDTIMYYVDTMTGGIDAFDFDQATGDIERRRRVVTVEDRTGLPDGLVVDTEGCLWLALWDGWAVHRYAPDGALLGVVDVPAARVTKPAFGGKEFSDLYVTTAAAAGPDPAQPHAGGVFLAQPGVRGLPSHAFGG